MKIKLPTKQSQTFERPGHFETDHVLAIKGTYRRFGVGGWNAEAEGRIEMGGPMVKGPYAYAFGLASVITDNPKNGTGAERQRKLAEQTEHDVQAGDVVELDGVEYTVQVERREYINLIPVK